MMTDAERIEILEAAVHVLRVEVERLTRLLEATGAVAQTANRKG